MLQVIDLWKSFGAADVLTGVTFSLGARGRAGLIGANGSGKTTLLRCITGKEQPDRGSVVLGPGLSPGYLAQEATRLRAGTVYDAVAAAQAEYVAAERRLAEATEALARGIPASDEAYDAALASFEALGGYGRTARAEAVLHGLGLSSVPPDADAGTLSGGQKTRLGLACLLLREPGLLLLDEPTNHLDVEALEWLEAFVRDYPGAVLAVSHDREFLDSTVDMVLHLDSGSVRCYPGSYTDFAAARARERQSAERAWKAEDAYTARVRKDIARLKGEALNIERSTTPREPGVRKFAKRKAAIAKAREHKLERYLDDPRRVAKPRDGWSLHVDFGPPPDAGREAIRLREVSAGYPGAQSVFNNATFDIHHGERVAVVGPNGAGKTTLLRVIAGDLVAARGEAWRSASVRAGFVAQEQEHLDHSRSVLATVLAARPMSETEARSFLHFFLFAGDAVHRLVGLCSPGERARLQLALLMLAGRNLLILDEPLNHLDIDGREHFEEALAVYRGTVIAVAHDRRFLRSFADRVIEVCDGAVRPFAGGYDDYLERRGRITASSAHAT